MKSTKIFDTSPFQGVCVVLVRLADISAAEVVSLIAKPKAAEPTKPKKRERLEWGLFFCGWRIRGLETLSRGGGWDFFFPQACDIGP